MWLNLVDFWNVFDILLVFGDFFVVDEDGEE